MGRCAGLRDSLIADSMGTRASHQPPQGSHVLEGQRRLSPKPTQQHFTHGFTVVVVVGSQYNNFTFSTTCFVNDLSMALLDMALLDMALLDMASQGIPHFPLMEPGTPGWRSLKPPIPTGARPARVTPKQPLAPAPATASAPAAAAEKHDPSWLEKNAWVMGGPCVAMAATSPRHAGGRTQRLLKSGEITLQELRAEWVKRTKDQDLSSPTPSRVSLHSRVGASITVRSDVLEPDEWREQAAVAAREKARAKRREGETAQAMEAAKTEALAMRVAEVQERLARRKARVELLAERRHAQWLESRLKTGLTQVLQPAADPMTRRAIELSNARHSVVDAMLPFNDFDGLAAPIREVERMAKAKARQLGGASSEAVRERANAKVKAEQAVRARRFAAPSLYSSSVLLLLLGPTFTARCKFPRLSGPRLPSMPRASAGELGVGAGCNGRGMHWSCPRDGY